MVFTASLLLRIFQFFKYENIFHVNDDIIAFLLHVYIVTLPMKGILNFIITLTYLYQLKELILGKYIKEATEYTLKIIRIRRSAISKRSNRKILY